MIDGISTDVFLLSTYPINVTEKGLSYVEKIKDLSNKKYTKPKKEVEEKISKILSKTKTAETVEFKTIKSNKDEKENSQAKNSQSLSKDI